MPVLPALSWTLLILLQLSSARGSASEDAASARCPSCALAGMRGGEAAEAQQDVVEAVKRHILNMLHLQARPNITRPVPRAALLNALRKLHVGRVAEDGSVQIEGEEQPRWRGGARRGGGGATATNNEVGDGGDTQETTEIITFAEAGDAPGVVNFLLSKEGGDASLVDQANVWLFLRLAKTNRSRTKVTIRLFQQRRRLDDQRQDDQRQDDQRQDDGLLLAEKRVDTRRSGWHTFPVSAAVQALLESSGSSALILRASCPLCADTGAALVLPPSPGAPERSQRSSQREQSHRPFLMAVVRQGDGGDSRRRRKRGLECDGKVRVCCKRQFYVNFKDIGWDDWIIAPTGYHANYCEGECPTHVASITGSMLSFHSSVLNHYRMRGHSPFQSLRSCCVPTRLRAMSMLYHGEEQKITKKDIKDMIVEECGCS